MRIIILGSLSASLFLIQSAQSPNSNETRANELFARAAAIRPANESPVAARLYERAADLYSVSDSRREQALRLAAFIYHRRSQTDRAKQLLERAAEFARLRGAPGRAAETYMDAAAVALSRQDRRDARRFMDRALLLIASSAVTEAERASVLRRLSQPVATLTMWDPN